MILHGKVSPAPEFPSLFSSTKFPRVQLLTSHPPNSVRYSEVMEPYQPTSSAVDKIGELCLRTFGTGEIKNKTG